MKKLIIYCLILISFAIKAQEKDNFLPNGNEEFATKNYAEAEANYRISQSKFKKKAASAYNLGTSIYKQDQFSESKYQFAKAIDNAKSKPEKHKVYHNMGNVMMKEKNYQAAVEAYKNALRNNPNDDETRYNYALAKKMAKDNPPKNKEKQKDKDKNKDKDKDKEKDKNEDKDNKDKDKKENENKGDNDKKEDNNNPKPKPSDKNKSQMQNLLDAVNNEEKKVQDKVKAQQVIGKPQKPEKDW